MRDFRPDIPPHVAEVVRHLPPELKRSIKQALRAIIQDPSIGDPLLRELQGLRKYSVRRFRIVYSIDHQRRLIRIFAIGHRREIYEQVADRIRRSTSER
jgi:mRNA interferase RelE/StbE